MEQHSIPRNITGFQFKLIGDMTLRQFGYLACGAVLGYGLFKLLPLPSIFNIGIGGFVAFLGFAFAFLPFQDRSIDQWILAFIKSVYAPTQYVYRKNNLPPAILTQTTAHALNKMVPGEHIKHYADSKRMLETYLSKLPKKTTDFFDQNEKIALSQTLSLFAQNTQSPMIPVAVDQTYQPAKPAPTTQVTPIILEAKRPRLVPPPVHPTLKESEKKQEAEKSGQNNQVKQLSDELDKLRQQLKEENKTQTIDPGLEKRFLELEQKLTGVLTEREKLTAELVKLKQQQTLIRNTVIPQVVTEPQPAQPRVTIISNQQAANVGFNPPTLANLITGIVNDQNNMSLANILITVKDMRGTPLRALKTNKLGQFYASTPLANGTYVLEVEDPQKRYAFDLIELKLTGTVIQPINIVAKKQRDPIREKLAKELFQKTFN